ncbi:MAG: hypothetical protein K0Q51_403 [Rickettsiaceae bacterium]|jgi:hypothetical protein|nr:hypothetical protein [Rickettsiaceae bacterium]
MKEEYTNQTICRFSPALNDQVVTELDLSKNKISDSEAKQIASYLKNSPSIQKLVFNDCGISVIGACILAEAIKMLPNLNLLDLSENYIGSNGASKILRALFQHGKIRILNFEENLITDDAAPLIAGFIKANNSLTDFRISHNSFDDEGYSIILESIKDNYSLAKLHLISKNILVDYKFQNQILSSLAENKYVTELECGEVSISNAKKQWELIKNNRQNVKNISKVITKLVKYAYAPSPPLSLSEVKVLEKNQRFIESYFKANSKKFLKDAGLTESDINCKSLLNFVEKYKNLNLFKLKGVCKEFSTLKESNFKLLPTEIILHILSFCSLDDIKNSYQENALEVKMLSEPIEANHFCLGVNINFQL